MTEVGYVVWVDEYIGMVSDDVSIIAKILLEVRVDSVTKNRVEERTWKEEATPLVVIGVGTATVIPLVGEVI